MSISFKRINTELNNLSNRIDDGQLNKNINEIKDKFSSTTETTVGKVLGDVQGGVKSLTEDVDNLVDKTVTIDKPVIGKITSDIDGLVDNISSSDLSKIDLMAGGRNLTTIFPSTKEQIDNKADRLYEIIGSVDPEGVSSSLRAALNKSTSDISDVLNTLTSSEFQDKISTNVRNSIDGTIISDVSNTLGEAADKFRQAVGGFTSGNVLKDIIENKTGEINNSISKLSDNINSALSKVITNNLLSGDVKKALDIASTRLPIPSALEKEALAIGIQTPIIKSKSDYESYASTVGIALPDNENVKVGIEDMKKNLSKAENTINVDITKSSKRITQIDNTVPSNTNIISSPGTKTLQASNEKKNKSTVRNASTLNSKEEVIKYLQSAQREITAVVWHWTANYIDQGHVGVAEIDRIHTARGFDGIGYHFVVKRDGTIEIGRNINIQGAHALGFNKRSIGISFVAGYNCASGTKNRHKYISASSITSAQMESFRLFMEGYYTVFPGGEAWGHADMPNNKGKVDPGFDVSSRVDNMFGKQNISTPLVDGRFLTQKELIRLAVSKSKNKAMIG